MPPSLPGPYPYQPTDVDRHCVYAITGYPALATVNAARTSPAKAKIPPEWLPRIAATVVAIRHRPYDPRRSRAVSATGDLRGMEEDYGLVA